MKSRTKLTTIIICVVILSVLAGFIYDAVMTSVEKSTHPRKYMAHVLNANEKYGIPEDILYAVIKVESNFDPDAVSSAGAYGLMQLLPETYEDMSGNAFSVEAITDPQSNINYGAKYLLWLYNRYSDWNTVFAAYNAGPGTVDGWLNDPTYSANGKTLHDIPYPETRNYVRKVSSARDTYIRLYYS